MSKDAQMIVFLAMAGVVIYLVMNKDKKKDEKKKDDNKTKNKPQQPDPQPAPAKPDPKKALQSNASNKDNDNEAARINAWGTFAKNVGGVATGLLNTILTQTTKK